MVDKEHQFIDEFTEMMKLKYDQNVEKKGHTWKDCSLEFLWEKLDEEHGEAQLITGPRREVMEELADVGVVVAMLYAREKENLINEMAEIWEGSEGEDIKE